MRQTTTAVAGETKSGIYITTVVIMDSATEGGDASLPTKKLRGTSCLISPQSWWFHSNRDYSSSKANPSFQCTPAFCRPQSLFISPFMTIFGKRPWKREVFFFALCYERSAKRRAKFFLTWGTKLRKSGRPAGRPVTLLKNWYLRNYASELQAVFTVGQNHSSKIDCNNSGLIWGLGLADSACRVKGVKIAR